MCTKAGLKLQKLPRSRIRQNNEFGQHFWAIVEDSNNCDRAEPPVTLPREPEGLLGQGVL